MAEISFGGLASGLPTEEIIKGLMTVERRPLERLESKKESESDRLRAFGEFKSKLDDLHSAVSALTLTSSVRTTAARTASDAPFAAVSNGGTTGNYDVAVAQLAQVQKTVGAGMASQSDPLLGTGTVEIGGETITIDDTNNSLQGLAAAINESAGTTGVRASIINDGTSTEPYRLVLTGDDTQTSFSPVVALTDSGGQPIDLGLVEVRSAQPAVAYVDSIKVVSNSNTATGVIPGVTLNLTEVSQKIYEGTYEEGISPDQWADPPQYETDLLTVEADTDALKAKVKDFVDSYNGIMDWISSGYIEFGAPVATAGDNGEKKESLALLLRGDATVNGAKRTLQTILSSSVNNSGELSALSQLGISTQRDGSLKLNTVTLETRVSQNFEDVGKLLAGDEQSGGVMKEFKADLLKMTSSTSGLYAGKKERYEAVVKQLDQQILGTEALLKKKENTLRDRFAAMETLVSSMNSQSSFLTQQMDMLANMIGK